MKKAAAILFFITYLVSTTEAYQLLKLPVVFQHFTEHKKADRHLSFLRFLAMHYLQKESNDGDYARDMKLPFKTSNSYVAVTITAAIPVMLQIAVEKPVLIAQKKNTIPDDQFILSSYLSNIWQPPRLC